MLLSPYLTGRHAREGITYRMQDGGQSLASVRQLALLEWLKED
jgi:hypothetical protein